MKIKELLTDESKWTKIYNARSAKGYPVNSDSPDAVCWCLIGAISKCYGIGLEFDRIKNLITSKLNTMGYNYIVEFNDEKATFADIRKLIGELDI